MNTIRSNIPQHGAFILRSPLYYRLQKSQSCLPPFQTSFRQISRTSAFRATAETQYSRQQKSWPRRVLSLVAVALTFTGAGFYMAAEPVFDMVEGLAKPPADAETLTMFSPQDETSRKVEDTLNNCDLAREMRSKPEYSESRPHLKIPEQLRTHNLTGGTLMGPGRLTVPPITWTESGKSLVQIQHLGGDLCGYPEVVHGGLIATLMDEGLARCCFGALPNKIGMTANLSIQYRHPVIANSVVVLRAKTTKLDGRKVWVEGRLEYLVPEGETPTLLAEASALFIEPRQAATFLRMSNAVVT